MDSHDLKVAIAAGGTAGHINPALSLAEILRKHGASVTFFGQDSKLEGTLVPEAGFPLVSLKMRGFDRSRPWTGIVALHQAHKAKKAIEKHFKTNSKPNVVVGFGAYVETPLIAWARENSIPVVLHEPNSVPGLATRMDAKAADVITYAFPQAKDALKKKAGHYTKFIQTGIPVRETVLEEIFKVQKEKVKSAKKSTGVNLLVMGGSLGAQSINEAMVASKEKLLGVKGLQILHITGKKNFEKTKADLKLSKEEEKRWEVRPYLDKVGEALGEADAILSRSGASTVAEIAVASVPAILVPYPHARGNHQAFNARLLSDVGAALIVKDDMLSSKEFQEELLGLLESKKRRDKMRKAAKKLRTHEAGDLLFDVVLSAAEEN